MNSLHDQETPVETKEATAVPKKSFLRKNLRTVILVAAGVLLIAIYLLMRFGGGKAEVSPDIQPDVELYAIPGDVVTYPTNLLFITEERMAYRDGDLQLEIPRLSLDCPVLDGTEADTLLRGVGLYEWSQTPGLINENISIAGHRDLAKKEFYEIDKLTEGDQLYLTYQGQRYTYQYLETHIIEPDDWSPLYSKEFPCLTLTSCHPIAVANKRIVVYAGLVDIQPA